MHWKTIPSTLQNKTATRPFEEQTSLEFFSSKLACSSFIFGLSKKHPNNPAIGYWVYGYYVLDMTELDIEKFVSLKDIMNSKCPEGTEPMLTIASDDPDVIEDYRRLNVFLLIISEAPR